MATILEFRSAPRPSPASQLAAPDSGRMAEIVFFPGVRYERAEEEPVKPKRTQRRRDTIEIEN